MRCSASHRSTSETRWIGDRETSKSGGTSSKDDGRIPNNPKLPLLVYPGALYVSDGLPSECEVLFGENGWGGTWRGRVFTYHHYHSTVHEVLGIVRGTARLAFGGESGVALELETGDVAVIPAGAGQ